MKVCLDCLLSQAKQGEWKITPELMQCPKPGHRIVETKEIENIGNINILKLMQEDIKRKDDRIFQQAGKIPTNILIAARQLSDESIKATNLITFMEKRIKLVKLMSKLVKNNRS